MDELVYNTLVQYFKLLANFGYVNYTNVYKVLFLISMQDLTTGGFRSLITEDDYRQIERALYKIFGTTCLVPYPQFCSDVNTGKFILLTYLQDLILQKVTYSKFKILKLLRSYLLMYRMQITYSIVINNNE